MEIDDPMLRPILVANPAIRPKVEALAADVDLRFAAKETADLAVGRARGEKDRTLVDRGAFLIGEANARRQPDPVRKAEYDDAVKRADAALAKSQDRVTAAHNAFMTAREIRDACFAYLVANTKRENADDY